MHGESKRRGELRRKDKVLTGFQGGVGGFYEAIMALMIVTLGVVLLTGSFTFLSLDQDRHGEDLEEACGRIMDSVLQNRSIVPESLVIDNRTLSHVDWAAVQGGWVGGLRVMVTFPEGNVRTLFQNGTADPGAERASTSQAIDLFDNQADVKVALLTVWVWP